MRIYAKLIILSLGLAIIPLGLVAVIFLYNAQKDLKREIYERLSAVSVLKKDRLETFFNSRKEDLRAVQGFLEVQTNLPTLEEFDQDRRNFVYFQASLQLNDQLRAFMNSYQYADILLLNTKGRVVFVANPEHVAAKMDKMVFEESQLAKAKEGVYISDPIAQENTAYPSVLYMILRALDPQGRFAGYVAFVVDMKVVYAFLADNTGIGQTAESFLGKETSDGKYLAISPLRYDPQAIFQKEVSPDPKETPANQTVLGAGIRHGLDYRGKKVLALWQHIHSLDWELVTKIDEEEAFAPVSNMRNLLISIVIVVLLLIGLSCVHFARSISGPIYRLREGAGIIGRGNLEHKVGVPTNDEVGELSRAFDEMVDNLKKTMASRDELEKEIEKRTEAEEQLRRMAKEFHSMSVHDPLTGVLNRRGLQDVLSKMLGMSQRMGLDVQALLLDLDNFKHINDAHGHGVGDAILTAVTQKIVQTVRQTDYVSRVGGDEFLVLLVDSKEADAVKVAEKIRVSVAQAAAASPEGQAVKTTCSIGIVPLGSAPLSVDVLLQKLHLSLHLSKGQGKNRIAYQGEQGRIELKNFDTTAAFKQVLMDGEKFYAASQPIFDLRNMTKTGYELLTRLDYEGYVAPEAFFAFARNADLLETVDYACMKTCLGTLKDLGKGKRVHINIFPTTLTEVPVERLLQDFSSAGHNIHFCLEINEQQIVGDPVCLVPPVARLKEAGVMIALDDYGFGRSCVEALILLEPDIVKIDKKIIKDIAKDQRKLNSLKRLLRVMESCKASVIAEGIENDQDLELLLELGVTSGQGFLMGKPEAPPNLG